MSDAEVVLTGLVYVFAALGLMILLIAGVSLAVRAVERARGKKKVKRIVAVPEPKRGEEGSVDHTGTKHAAPDDAGKGEAQRADNDGEVVAAITAAIAAFQAEGRKPRFRILSFKRIGRD